MEILRSGIGDNTAKKFTCPECWCLFKAFLTEYREESSCYICNCPHCGSIATLSKSNK